MASQPASLPLVLLLIAFLLALFAFLLASSLVHCAARFGFLTPSGFLGLTLLQLDLSPHGFNLSLLGFQLSFLLSHCVLSLTRGVDLLPLHCLVSLTLGSFPLTLGSFRLTLCGFDLSALLAFLLIHLQSSLSLLISKLSFHLFVYLPQTRWIMEGLISHQLAVRLWPLHRVGSLTLGSFLLTLSSFLLTLGSFLLTLSRVHLPALRTFLLFQL
jgi:hypothetical protein